jgi:pimeloyl-ACP methyl ester carboxylesterase
LQTSHPENEPAFENLAEDDAARWYLADHQQKPTGVAIVIHGLNLRPARMEPIIAQLRQSGIDTLNVSLRGHGENFDHRCDMDGDKARLETFKAVSYPLWTKEAHSAYLQAEKRSTQKQVPLFFIGFSLGGLIGLDLFASRPDVRFERMVLFAPALKLHASYYLGRILSSFPRLVIPSLAPKDYLSNQQGTPMAAYNALFEGLDRFEGNASSRINIPTLLIIDEQDELIPYWALKRFVEEKKLDRWRFFMVEKGRDADAETFHHHIIDAYSTGNSVWQQILKAVSAHLLGNGS